MIVIKKEDQPKLILLSVALVGVLGFVGMQVSSAVGGPQKLVARASAPPAAKVDLMPASQPIEIVSQLPSPNEADPFRQVLLDRDSGQRTPPSPPPKPLPGASFGNHLEPMPIGEVQLKPVVVPPLRLDGIVTGRNGAAIASVGDRTEVLGLGKSIGDYTLVRFDSRSATFSTKKGSVRLLVGEETKPVEPPPVKTAVLPFAQEAAAINP